MVWTFGHGERRIEVRREVTADGPMLVVTGGPAPFTSVFADMSALLSHQNRLEATLVHDGWSLLSFEPERRTNEERRAATRDTLDRRRWWTDPHFRNR